MDQRKVYQVEIAQPAAKRYNLEVLTYLSDHFSEERVYEIDDSIIDTVRSLSTFPHRGTIEQVIEDPIRTFRYILHRETRNFELKIIYYVNDEVDKVIVTDFFPTGKDLQDIILRN